MSREVHLSQARMYGWGSDPWKGVSYLSDSDKAAFHRGALVVITGGRPQYGRHGTTIRRLAWTNFWNHRTLTREELAMARRAGIEG